MEEVQSVCRVWGKGNSKVITIPIEVMEALSLEEGDLINVRFNVLIRSEEFVRKEVEKEYKEKIRKEELPEI